MRKNEEAFNRNYYENATQRADAQAMLNAGREEFRNANVNAAGASAVSGATGESLAQNKAAAANALGNATAQIAMAGERRKDAAESVYRTTDDSLNASLRESYTGQAQQMAAAANQASQAGAALFGQGLPNQQQPQ